jgi:hypothetical protein
MRVYQGDYLEAEGLIKGLESRSLQDPYLWAVKAELYHIQGKEQQALAMVEKAHRNDELLKWFDRFLLELTREIKKELE